MVVQYLQASNVGSTHSSENVTADASFCNCLEQMIKIFLVYWNPAW